MMLAPQSHVTLHLRIRYLYDIVIIRACNKQMEEDVRRDDQFLRSGLYLERQVQRSWWLSETSMSVSSRQHPVSVLCLVCFFQKARTLRVVNNSEETNDRWCRRVKDLIPSLRQYGEMSPSMCIRMLTNLNKMQENSRILDLRYFRA